MMLLDHRRMKLLARAIHSPELSNCVPQSQNLSERNSSVCKQAYRLQPRALCVTQCKVGSGQSDRKVCSSSIAGIMAGRRTRMSTTNHRWPALGLNRASRGWKFGI
jgi:hypothetical protein